MQIGTHWYRWNYIYDLVLDNHEEETSQFPRVHHDGFRRLADMQELRDNFVAPITTKSPDQLGPWEDHVIICFTYCTPAVGAVSPTVEI